MVQKPIIIMGVAGSGKSTVGSRLSQRLGVPFCEGDDVHPPANIAKMTAGQPLNDHDRAPWLARINVWLHEHQSGGIVSCSALRRTYRDRLRRGLFPEPSFVLLDPPREVLERRLLARTAHFMPSGLLDSQLTTLERPTADERALCLASETDLDATAQIILDWLGADAFG